MKMSKPFPLSTYKTQNKSEVVRFIEIKAMTKEVTVFSGIMFFVDLKSESKAP